MSRQRILYAFGATLVALCFAGVYLASASEPAKSTGGRPKRVPTAAETDKIRLAANSTSSPSMDPAPVHELAVKLTSAFNRRDAAAFAAVFTPEGEYIDEAGNTFRGRRAIEAEFHQLLTANPETKIRVQFGAPRMIAMGIVAADGQTQLTHNSTAAPAIPGQCQVVIATEDDRWQIASLRETEADPRRTTHHDQVAQLAWLIGDWIDEGANYHVHFSCRWDESGNYLLRAYSVTTGGQKVSSGTQRIGYDPSSRRLKSWVFDSTGAFSEGFVHQDGESWTIDATGVTADGSLATGKNVFTRVDDHRIVWQAVGHVVDGQRIGDTGKIFVVRKPPVPAARAR